MATEIYNQVIGQQNFTMGATVSVVLLIPALLACVVDRLVQRRQYALVSSSARPLVPGGTTLARSLLFGYCALIAVCILAIYFVIFASSVVTRWPYNLTLTLKHYRFDSLGGYTALLNSVWVAALTAVIGTGITFAGAYLVEKCRTALNGVLYLFALLPVAVPGMVLGLAYICVQRLGSDAQPIYGTAGDPGRLNLPLLHGPVPDGDHHAEADGRVRERLGLMGVAFYRTFWRVTVPIALLHRRRQHVLLPQRDGDAVGRRSGRPGTELAAVAAARRRRRDGPGDRHVGADHRHRLLARSRERCSAALRRKAWTTATHERAAGHDEHARVVIIGGGVIGASVAYHLTRLGRDVRLP